MNFGNLLFFEPANIKRIIRTIERMEKKLAHTRIYIYIFIYLIGKDNLGDKKHQSLQRTIINIRYTLRPIILLVSL